METATVSEAIDGLMAWSMARPRVPPDERRTASLNPRLTEAEKAAIERDAALLGISPGELMRRCTLGYRLPVTLAAQRVEATRNAALLRIGVNLNQLTRYAHAGRLFSDQLSAVLAEVSTVLDSFYDHR